MRPRNLSSRTLTIFQTGHFVTDGLANDPAEVDDYMSRGYWPEKDRTSSPDDLPIAALGSELRDLFDLAFSLDPSVRPSPDTWRRALTKALHNCWIHDCGQAFVAAPGESTCPGCGQPLTVPSSALVLKITVQDTGVRCSAEIIDRQPIILGRSTIADLPGVVSGRHLEIIPFGDRLLLRHVGRHDTLVQQQGTWYQLQSHWFGRHELSTQPLKIQLAGCDLELQMA